MKKILALVLFAALFATLAMPAMALINQLPTAPKADIIIDGVRDDGYGDMFEIKSYRDGGSGTGATAKIWAAWNDTGVFYYAEVNDTTPNHEHANSYERDNIEFFIDWSATPPAADVSLADNAWQVRIPSAPAQDGSELLNSGTLGADVLTEGTHYVVKPLNGGDLKGGYIVELLLPYSYTEGAPALAAGRTLSVDFQVADNELNESRSSQAFVDGTHELTDSQWDVAEAFTGLLPLGEAKPTPVTEAPPVEAAAGGGEAADAEIAPVVQAATTSAPQTGDSMMIFVILGIALIGAVAISKRIGAVQK